MFLKKKLKEFDYENKKTIVLEGTEFTPSKNIMCYLLQNEKTENLTIADFGENPAKLFYLFKRCQINIDNFVYYDLFSDSSYSIEGEYPITSQDPYTHKGLKQIIKTGSKKIEDILSNFIQELKNQQDKNILVIFNFQYYLNLIDQANIKYVYQFLTELNHLGYQKVFLCFDQIEQVNNGNIIKNYLVSKFDILISCQHLESGYSKDVSGHLIFKDYQNEIIEKKLKFKQKIDKIEFFDHINLK